MLLHLVETGIIKTGRPQVARPVAKLHLSGSFFDHIWSDVSCVLPQESCEKQICSGRDTIEFQLGFVSKAELQTKIAQLYDVCVEQQGCLAFLQASMSHCHHHNGPALRKSGCDIFIPSSLGQANIRRFRYLPS